MISVIIPVYNMEQYLGRCVDSVLGSAFRDFEVILVDDGSTDGCGEICKSYAQKDGRVKYIHQENQGVSAARNRGLEEAVGEWVVFADADDYISPDFLSLVDREEYCQYDLLLFDYFPLKERGWKKRRPGRKEPVVYSGEAIAREFTEKMLRFQSLEPGCRAALAFPWGKAYRRGLIERSQIRFAREIGFSEDLLFNMEYWQAMKSCLYIPKTVYLLQSHMSSATRRYNPHRLAHHIRMEAEIKRILQRGGMFLQLEEYFYIHALSMIVYVLLSDAFDPRSRMKFEESRAVCEEIRVNEIFREALQYNRKNPILKSRIAIFLFQRRWYHMLKAVCWGGYFFQRYIKRA
ncbi:glycosyltransferase family 2 protein [Acutalibacter sp. 1XD8-33]|uniref:glycosyltransferase family 2 protein n=1 Tax=Acutalibacter sp. 1XD8-33 TaxID=2320081 RepID=UPI0018F2F541|nr:glycosyltransferase family 2 protein [Acutalibacter sp. 1XD8-33]